MGRRPPGSKKLFRRGARFEGGAEVVGEERETELVRGVHPPEALPRDVIELGTHVAVFDEHIVGAVNDIVLRALSPSAVLGTSKHHRTSGPHAEGRSIQDREGRTGHLR